MLANLLLNGGAADDKLYVEDVFSTWLYSGAGGTQTINNGIDLAGKGGLVWTKVRTGGSGHALVDTARGGNSFLATENTNNASTALTWLQFNSTGYVADPNNLGLTAFVSSGQPFTSWTFRKAPKFFDVVTWTGNNVDGRTINHSLGVTPGMIIVKRTDADRGWVVWHRGDGTTEYSAALNTTAAGYTVDLPSWVTTASSTTFTVNGSNNNWNSIIYSTNETGGSYVAYLFAHDTSADGIVQCGSFTTNGSSTASVTLGWEPQYIITKSTSSVGHWRTADNMRGLTVGNDATLQLNTSAAETSGTSFADPTPTGFDVNGHAANTTFIYLAIRRGPMRTPTDATKVFKPVIYNGDGNVGRVVNYDMTPDAVISATRDTTNNIAVASRLTGKANLYTTDTSAESEDRIAGFDTQLGLRVGEYSEWNNNISSVFGSYVNWAFRRAPGFFDVTCYSGTGSARTVSHNLGVAPELMIVKARTGALNFIVYAASEGATKYLFLSDTRAATTWSGAWNNTNPTSSVFTVGNGQETSEIGRPYVAYLFASCTGVSKVGSYTGNGSSQNINCGFTNGARFVLIKRTDSTGDWYVWDTARGIVSGNDPHLSLNSTAAEVTSNDTIDPLSTGFTVNQVSATNVNASSATYIYLAIS